MKSLTPSDGPVNVTRYTLYAMIPGLDTYVSSKLDKKKFTTIYSTIFIMGILALTGIVMYQMSIDPELVPEMDNIERTDMIYEKFMPQMITIIIGSMLIHFPIYIYLVRRWAKE